MESIYLWPEHPIGSLALLWVVSVVFLWAARDAALEFLAALGEGITQGLASLSGHVRQRAEEIQVRSEEVLLAAGTRDAQGRLNRELERIDAGFSEQLGQYSKLQLRLDERLLALDRDYQKCGISPPDVPGWSAAVETIAGLPMNGDPNVQKILEGIKRSSQDVQLKALSAYRDDTAKRHKVLRKMLPCWKEIRGLLSGLKVSVHHALESTGQINGFIEDYVKIREDRDESARALTYSAWKFFFVSMLVLGVALGGVFINFQLIALPMSELVPAGARIGSVAVSTVSALVLVLMEAALGIFLMDMLGITELFPRLASIPLAKRRLILWLAFFGLLFLSGVESSLAILREQIVEADAVLKLSLAGEDLRIIETASQSSIPIIGQAVLGFILPWILALVAIPLEMLLDCGRHIVATLAVWFLRTMGALMIAGAHIARHSTRIIKSLYEVYICIPLRIERMLGYGDDAEMSRPRRTAQPSTSNSLA